MSLDTGENHLAAALPEAEELRFSLLKGGLGGALEHPAQGD